MCEPTTALAVASAVIGAAGTYAEIKATNAAAQAEQRAARGAYAADMMAVEERGLQTQRHLTTEAFERQRQALRDRSKILVGAGEAGVGGNTLLRELSQSFLKESYDTGIMSKNTESALVANELQAQRIWATKEGRINAAKSREVNPFMGALMIGASAATGYYSSPGVGGV